MGNLISALVAPVASRFGSRVIRTDLQAVSHEELAKLKADSAKLKSQCVNAQDELAAVKRQAATQSTRLGELLAENAKQATRIAELFAENEQRQLANDPQAFVRRSMNNLAPLARQNKAQLAQAK